MERDQTGQSGHGRAGAGARPRPQAALAYHRRATSSQSRYEPVRSRWRGSRPGPDPDPDPDAERSGAPGLASSVRARGPSPGESGPGRGAVTVPCRPGEGCAAFGPAGCGPRAGAARAWRGAGRAGLALPLTPWHQLWPEVGLPPAGSGAALHPGRSSCPLPAASSTQPKREFARSPDAQLWTPAVVSGAAQAAGYVGPTAEATNACLAPHNLLPSPTAEHRRFRQTTASAWFWRERRTDRGEGKGRH